MAGGYSAAPEDGIVQLLRRLDTAEGRLRELERPTGTQVAQTVATVEDIEALQIAIDTSGNSASSVSVSTSYANIVSFTVNVPDGFTRANVSAVGFWNAGNTDAMDGVRAYTRLVIGGTAGPESIGGMISVATVLVGCSASRSFTVTPGGSFTVVLQGRNQVGTTGSGVVSLCVANATATTLFQR